MLRAKFGIRGRILSIALVPSAALLVVGAVIAEYLQHLREYAHEAGFYRTELDQLGAHPRPEERTGEAGNR
ncbi:hypothetical protein [Nocardia sp. NPDC004860]|uniref:hypothetical protein n=1 Tax=Nocardia sp. NPDC004860 TaxID=3154557 RepID=UPI0033B466E2